MTTATFTQPRTLVDRLPITDSRTRSAVAIVGFAVLTAACAQWRMPLPWTPVPITGQTMAVLLAGASLGAWRGAASQALYVAVGALGMPIFQNAEGGWDVVAGTTGGYLVGFIVAAGIVGLLAERRQDRQFASSLSAMALGSAIIYICGAGWLAHHLGVSSSEAIELGIAPFLIGDVLKAAIAGALLPTAWRLLGERD